ncbi:MAG: PilZ domain-containing protein [Myxococcota bacterium]
MANTRALFVVDAELARRPDLLLDAVGQDGIEIVAVDGLAAIAEQLRGRELAAVIVGSAALVRAPAVLAQLRQAQPLAAVLLIAGPGELGAVATAVNAQQVDLVLPRGAADGSMHVALKRGLLLADQRRLQRAGVVALQAMAQLHNQPTTALGGIARELRELAVAIDALVQARQALLTEVPVRPVAPTSPGTRDARVHARIPLVVDVRLDGDDIVAMGVSENISTGGIFVTCEQSFALGTVVRLTFRLPALTKPVRCEANVVWHRPARRGPTALLQRDGIGLRFVALGPEVAEAIDTLTRAWDEEGDAQLERLTL